MIMYQGKHGKKLEGISEESEESEAEVGLTIIQRLL